MAAAETIAGRYDLLEVLGRGGMSVVYRALDRVLDRTVAVKILPAAYAENPTLVERFVREARAAAGLNHPNIVAVYDSGTDRTVHYIVMECVAGTDLAHVMRERGALPIGDAAEIAAQIASALSAAHAAGIIHRDIKPANVMIQPSGSIKVLDFGIARARDDADLTRATTVLGSAPYMAPEVAMGGSADERSDIYSLGCVLYEMVTGSPPFMAELPLAVMHLHANVEPQPVRKLRPDVPAGFETVILGMLAKRPEERPQHAAELVSVLVEAARADTQADVATVVASNPPAAPAVRVRAKQAPPPNETLEQVPPVLPRSPDAARVPPASSRSPRRGWLVAAAVLAAIAVGVAIALAASSNSRRTPSSRRSHTHRSIPPRTSGTSTSSSGSSTPSTSTSQSRTTTSSSSTSSTTSTPSTTSTSSSTTSSTAVPSASSTAATSPTTTTP
jgi:serine/threonine protein kinase